jgi:lipoate-protein ligase A
MPDRRTWITAAAVSAALAGGGIAGAALGSPVLAGAQEDPTTTTVVDDDGEAAACEGFHIGRHAGFLADLDVAAEALGIPEDDLREALRDGQTIAEVAEAQDVDPQAVIDALVADATARIDEAVADGDLDADEAEEIKADLPERITDLVNGEGFPVGPGFRHGRGFAHLDLDVAAEALGISEDDLRDALRDGQTIAEVAEAQDVDPQAVIDALVADATTRIDEAVADGDLDADEAEEIKADLPERITDLVNGEGLRFGPGFGGPGFPHDRPGD